MKMSVCGALLAMLPFLAIAEETEARPHEPGDPIDLAEAIRAAQEANPHVQSLRRAFEARLERPEQERVLPDPMLSYAFMIEDTVTANGPITGILELSQEIPFLRKRPLRAEVSIKEAEAVRHAWEAARLDVALAVSTAYHELFRVDRTIILVEAEGDLLDRLEEVVRRRYATGIARQGDVLRAQVERSLIEERLLRLSREREAAASAFNAALGRPASASVGRAEEPPDRHPRLPPDEALYEASRSARPEVAEARRLAEAGTLREALARRDFYPDFRVAVQWSQVGSSENPLAPDSGQDAYMITVGVSLPVWREGLKAGVRETAAMTEAAHEQVRDLTVQAESEVRALLAATRSQRNLASLYESSIIPQAEASLQSAEAAYEAGGADFLDVLDSERRLLAAKIAEVEALSDLGKSLAALERAVGRDLPSLTASLTPASAGGGA